MMPFPQGSVPLHWMGKDTFPPLLASNKECFFLYIVQYPCVKLISTRGTCNHQKAA